MTQLSIKLYYKKKESYKACKSCITKLKFLQLYDILSLTNLLKITVYQLT